jgi:DUF1680 family protein
MAVTNRGWYATGGQTSGEAWTPPHMLASRLGVHNQEHCVVYNMMRLADVLCRWTGDLSYADYWERNFYNGLLAQEHPVTGMVAYYLPMKPGKQKKWGHPTEDFWCCHGSLVQAPPSVLSSIYYRKEDGVLVNQYIPSSLSLTIDNTAFTLTQGFHATTAPLTRPVSYTVRVAIQCEKPTEATIDFRIPWWVKGDPIVRLGGEAIQIEREENHFSLKRMWSQEEIIIDLPKEVTFVPTPDDPRMGAFMDGPIVLAGLCDGEISLETDGKKPEELLIPDDEYGGECWKSGYKTRGQDRNIEFIPLHRVTDEHYAIYFPTR